jgi:hypothetical protein
MAEEHWLSFGAVVNVISCRLGVDAGRAQSLAGQAIESMEIRLSYSSSAVAREDREAHEDLRRTVQKGAPGLKMSGSMLHILRSQAQRDAHRRAASRQILFPDFESAEFRASLAAGDIQINKSDLEKWLSRYAETAMSSAAPADFPPKGNRYVGDDDLVSEGVKGLKAGRWANPHQAALELAKRASGPATLPSKVSRIDGKIRRQMPSRASKNLQTS